jgi:hypothetical protein
MRLPPPGSFLPVKAIVTIIYKPIGIIAGILAGLLSKKIFDFLWSKVDEEEPPKPNTQWADWPKLLGAAALQGMVFKVVRAIVDRETAKAFHYLTGVWPGEKAPDRA